MGDGREGGNKGRNEGPRGFPAHLRASLSPKGRRDISAHTSGSKAVWGHQSGTGLLREDVTPSLPALQFGKQSQGPALGKDQELPLTT